MGNENNKIKELNPNNIDIARLQNNFQMLQNKLERLENIKNVTDVNNLNIVDIADIISKMVLKQVEKIIVQVIDRNTKANVQFGETVYEFNKLTSREIGNMKTEMKRLESVLIQNNQEIYDRINQDCMKVTECEIDKVKKDIKQLEKDLTSNNNMKCLELQDNVKRLERELKQNMNQHQKEMNKINNILDCGFNEVLNDSAKYSTHVKNNKIRYNSIGARMMEENNTIMKSINYCTHNNSDIWNNFERVEFFSNQKNFHGKFVLASDDNNLKSEISILNFCKRFGLNDDGINVQRLKNTRGISHLFVIQINNIFLRNRFLAIVKSNMGLSIALFSHRYKFNTSGGNQHCNGVARWFKKRWRSIQSN